MDVVFDINAAMKTLSLILASLAFCAPVFGAAADGDGLAPLCRAESELGDAAAKSRARLTSMAREEAVVRVAVSCQIFSDENLCALSGCRWAPWDRCHADRSTPSWTRCNLHMLLRRAGAIANDDRQHHNRL